MDLNKNKNKKKRILWNEAAEAALIELWREKMPQLRSARRNGNIYEEVASELGVIGHLYSAAEVKVKLHNFSNRYRQEKQKVGLSGGSPSTWKFYGAVHAALGSHKSYCAEELTEDSIMVDLGCSDTEIYVECETDGESAICAPLPRPCTSSAESSNMPSVSESAKKKKKTAVSVMEEMRTDFLKATEEMKEADEKRFVVLQQYANNVSEMKDAFIDFLRRQN